MTNFLRRMTLYGGVAFLLANILFLVTQAALAAGVPLGQVFGEPLLQLLRGRSGFVHGERYATGGVLVGLGLLAAFSGAKSNH